MPDMPVEYDLVIIGAADSQVGRWAAESAAQYPARIALIEPPSAPASALPQILMELGRLRMTQSRLAAFGGSNSEWRTVDWTAIPAAVAALEQRHQGCQDPGWLADRGIDYIVGSGAFYRKPRLGFEVNGRQLRARAYLVIGPTDGAAELISPKPSAAAISGLEHCHTPATLGTALAAGTVGKTIAILGGEATGVTLAQSLQRLGFEVILLTAHSHILSAVDATAAGLVQALLEAEGVDIWTQTAVPQVAPREGQTWLRAGTADLIVDTVVLAAELGAELGPVAEALNLAAASVHWSAAGIAVDARQRAARRIYVCQDRQLLPQVVKQALFPWARADRQTLGPVTLVDCDPPLASIGLGEAAARARYGDLQVVRQSFRAVAQLQDGPTGLCQLMVRRNGTIVGGQILGPAAPELAHTLALALQAGVPLQDLGGLDLSGPTGPGPRSAIFSQLARQWQGAKLSHSEWLESWFAWCRSVAR
jgi:pyruvate/2-oxoglutarate dehydrogenase complex dihydrolipoamide dehydrogenase (E3) component